MTKITKIGQRGGASRGRVCYQRGLPRLVFHANCKKPSNVVLPYPTLPPDSASEVTAATDAGGV